MVVADDLQHMAALPFQPDGKGGVAPLVRRDRLPVQPDFSGLCGAFQQQEGRLSRKFDVTLVRRRTPVVGGGVPVFRIIGMGHPDFGPFGAVLAERPAVQFPDLGGILLGGK